MARALGCDFFIAEDVAEIDAIDELHDEEVEAVDLAEIMNGDNGGVAELGEEFGLVGEAGGELGIALALGGEVMAGNVVPLDGAIAFPPGEVDAFFGAEIIEDFYILVTPLPRCCGKISS